MSTGDWIAVGCAVWSTGMLLVTRRFYRATLRRRDELAQFLGTNRPPATANEKRQLLKRRRREARDPVPEPRPAAENRYTRPELYDQETRGEG